MKNGSQGDKEVVFIMRRDRTIIYVGVLPRADYRLSLILIKKEVLFVLKVHSLEPCGFRT